MADHSTTQGDGSARSAAILPAIVVSGVWLLLARHAAGYFFVIDDYALVGEALTSSISRIFAEPLFGFYRPVAFLFVKAETLLYSWTSPSAFAAVSATLHGINAALVGVLTRRITHDRAAAWLAGAFFFASPWAAEAFLWASGRFDLLATLGALSTIIVAMWGAERPDRLRVAIPAVALLGSLATASKESAIVVPALLLMLAAFLKQPSDVRRRLVFASLSAAIGNGAYLALRQRLLPGLGGAYGHFGDLVSAMTLMNASTTHGLAFVVWPLPASDTGNGIVATVIAVPLICGAVPAMLWKSRGQWLLLTACVILGLITLGPVVWAPPSGRFLYLPGVWFAIGIGVVLGQWLRTPPGESSAIAVGRWAAPLFVAAYAIISLHAQIGWWGKASTLARNGMQSFARALDQGLPGVHVTNLPFRCVEGPVILTSYAFQHFYRGHTIPAIRATAHLVRCESHGAEQLSTFPDPLLPPADPLPGEIDLELQLLDEKR